MIPLQSKSGRSVRALRFDRDPALTVFVIVMTLAIVGVYQTIWSG